MSFGGVFAQCSTNPLCLLLPSPFYYMLFLAQINRSGSASRPDSMEFVICSLLVQPQTLTVIPRSQLPQPEVSNLLDIPLEPISASTANVRCKTTRTSRAKAISCKTEGNKAKDEAYLVKQKQGAEGNKERVLIGRMQKEDRNT